MDCSLTHPAVAFPSNASWIYCTLPHLMGAFNNLLCYFHESCAKRFMVHLKLYHHFKALYILNVSKVNCEVKQGSLFLHTWFSVTRELTWCQDFSLHTRGGNADSSFHLWMNCKQREVLTRAISLTVPHSWRTVLIGADNSTERVPCHGQIGWMRAVRPCKAERSRETALIPLNSNSLKGGGL